MTPFVKMNGLGNDFVIFDESMSGPLSLTKEDIRFLCDRRRGIGCDQLILLTESREKNVARNVHFYNADGSYSAACGNGTRCIIGLLHKKTGQKEFQLRTRTSFLRGKYKGPHEVEVDMGLPHFSSKEIPLSSVMDTLHLPVIGDPCAVSMGNPHATFFGDNFTTTFEDKAIADVTPLYPQGVNVGFAEVKSPTFLTLRVHERGAGYTLACGTGACATVVNAARRGYVNRACYVEMPGGMLHVRWSQEDGHVYLTGDIRISFWGEIPLGASHS